MKSLGYLVQYWLLELVELIARALPLRAALALGRSTGAFFWRLGVRRDVAIGNLALAYPNEAEARLTGLARSVYRNLGANLFELMRLPSIGRQELLGMVRLEGIEHFQRAQQDGRGALLITGHFGNWELWSAIASAGFPVSMVVYPQHNSWVDGRLNSFRRGKGCEVIYKRDAAREIFLALRRKRFVAILIDQDAGSNGIFVDFLGHPASTPKGPAVFAVKTGAPLITGAIVRTGPGRHIGYIDPPIYADPTAANEPEVQRLTQLITDNLCRYIRQYPDHWYWVHRRWKTRPPGHCHPERPPGPAG